MGCIKHAFDKLNCFKQEDPKPKPPPLTFRQKALLYFQDYCVNAHVNGIFYLSENRSIGEKIFWIISILISLGCGIYMFLEMIIRFQNRPVLVTYGTKETPIYTIPFPAVTICTEEKFTDDFNYTFIRYLYKHNKSQLNEESRKKIQYLQYFCDRDKNITGPKHYAEDFYQTILELQPALSSTFGKCSFMKKTFKECSEIFVPTLTDRGICYSFNMISKKELFSDITYFAKPLFESKMTARGYWDISHRYLTDDVDVFPRRAMDSGIKYCLHVILIASSDDSDYTCRKFSHQGFRVQVHSPIDVPRLSSHYFQVPFDAQATSVIKPSLDLTSAKVERFAPSKRKCFFPGEKLLRFFKIYTKENCVLECYTNWTLKECDCVEFFMPREESDRICGVGKLDCTTAARKTMKEMEVSEMLDSNQFQHCGCLPLCNRLKYTSSNSYSNWDHENFIRNNKKLSQLLNQTGARASVLRIYMGEQQFLPVERHELFNISDFIANFGGLMGLFTGVSFISLIEVLYFCTIRLFFSRKAELAQTQ